MEAGSLACAGLKYTQHIAIANRSACKWQSIPLIPPKSHASTFSYVPFCAIPSIGSSVCSSASLIVCLPALYQPIYLFLSDRIENTYQQQRVHRTPSHSRSTYRGLRPSSELLKSRGQENRLLRPARSARLPLPLRRSGPRAGLLASGPT